MGLPPLPPPKFSEPSTSCKDEGAVALTFRAPVPKFNASIQQAPEKQRKAEILREKKLLAAQSECADALTYIEMYHSPAAWKSARDVQRNFSKLASKTAKRDAMKE